MPYAETQAACEALRAQFTTRYRKLAPKAVERLADDWERLVTFYQFPREHWPHLQHHERRRVALCHGTAAHHGGQTLQEGRERHGVDLEDVASGRVHLPPTQRSGVAASRVCGSAVLRWCASEGETAQQQLAA